MYALLPVSRFGAGLPESLFKRRTRMERAPGGSMRLAITRRRTDRAHHLQHGFFRPRSGPCVIFGDFRAL